MLRECYTFLGSIFSFALCVSEADLKYLEGIYAFQRIPIDSRKPWSVRMRRMPDSLFFQVSDSL